MNYFLKRWNLTKAKDKLTLLKGKILSLYINTELLEFLNFFFNNVASKTEKEYYLQFCKKLICQAQRLPNKEHFEYFKDEYKLLFRSIKEEQITNDPIKWIDAELHFIKATKELKLHQKNEVDVAKHTETQKDWLTFSGMLTRFGTSKMALRRRMAEGMPFVKFGNQLRFFPSLVDEWLVSRG